MATSRSNLPSLKAVETVLGQGDAAVPAIRDMLQSVRDSLHDAQNHGTASVVIVNKWTRFIDQLLIAIWHRFTRDDPQVECCSLVAVGGYGRAELHPSSDIDLMILVTDRDESLFTESSKQFLHLLWDIGLDVGHSVRTVGECVTESEDLTVITNLMEARLLCGAKPLFDAMQEALSPDRIWPAAEYFRAKLVEQKNRYARYDDTAYKLEPNIKESPGGLRDLQMIGWVAKRHFNAQSLAEFVARGFLTDKEHRSLVRCRNFLWRIRNALHFLTGRREDRLLFEHQRVLAKEFGYDNKEGSLAVEQLMKRYYRTVKELGQLKDILLQHFEEEFVAPSDFDVVPINRRFNAINGYIETVHPDVFQRQPFALLEIFMLFQEHDELKGIRASTIRLIHASLHLIDRDFRQDLACRAIFIRMFRTAVGLTHVLRKMNQYGVLGAYFPAFGRIVGQMQHDLFHIYTVDVHSLFVVRNLRRLSIPKYHDEFPLASRLVRKIFKPERLYLAGLLHDIAKGRGGDHSVLGESISYRFCKLHDLSAFDAKFVAWLVRNHLIMSWTAQRLDTSDPSVIADFAGKIRTQEKLDNLYLLTMADIRGTSPNVWNDWKGKLLEELYHATTSALRRGLGSTIDDAERLADRRQILHDRLVPGEISEQAFSRYWNLFDNDYYLRYHIDALEYHIRHISTARAIDLPLVAVRYSELSASTIVIVFTPDIPTLLVRTTAGFDHLNLNIVDARLHTSHSGYAMHSYAVLDRNDQPICDQASMIDIGDSIRKQLIEPRKGRDPRKAHLPRSVKQFPMPVSVSFSAALHGHTHIEVVAQDRPGLLYQIADAFEVCGIKMHNARVATFGARVEDIFDVTDLSGKALTDEEQRRCLQKEIISRFDEPATQISTTES